MRYLIPTLLAEGMPHAIRWERLPFEVREVDAAQAPVAVTMETTDYGRGPFEWRYWDGMLWERCQDGMGVPTRAETDGVTPMREIYGAGLHPLLPTNPQAFWFYARPNGHMGELGALVGRTKFADSLAMVEERVRNTIIIDGVFYRRSAGPRMWLTVSGDIPVMTYEPGMMTRLPSARCAYAAPEDVDVVRDAVNAAWKRPVVIKQIASPRFHIDLPFGLYDGVGNAIEGAAANILFHLRASRLEDASPEAIEHLIKLRRIYLERWPHMAGSFSLNEGDGFRFEKDRIDWPDGETALAAAIVDAPDSLIALTPAMNQLQHRVAARRITIGMRHNLDIGEDEAAMSHAM